jgi:prepilin-type N-terminal cleavage/methylation domain-containing protein
MFGHESIRPAHRPGSGQPSASFVQLDRLARAFTLVEMLVVVALIGILAALVGFSLTGGTQGMSLANAQRGLLSMIRAAQAAAQVHNTRARLIIFSDQRNWESGDTATAANVNSKILRQYGVIYASSDDPNLTGDGSATGKPYYTWTAFNDGAQLPEGIYFVPSKDSGFAKGVPNFAATHNAITTDYTYTPPASMDDHFGTTTGIMQINYPLGVPSLENQGDWYYFIEFAPDGVFYNANGNNNILLGAATQTSASTINFGGTGTNANRLFTGVQLRYLGGAAAFRDESDFDQTGAGQ